MPLDPVRIDEIGVANCGWNVREPGSTVGSCYRDDSGKLLQGRTAWRFRGGTSAGFGAFILTKFNSFLIPKSRVVQGMSMVSLAASIANQLHQRVICNFQIAGGHLSQN